MSTFANLWQPPSQGAYGAGDYTTPNLQQFFQPFGPGTFGNLLYQDNPRAAEAAALHVNYASNPTSAHNEYIRQQLSQRGQNQFLAVAPQRGPNYTYMDYLPEMMQQLEGEFQGQSATQRGENPRAYSGRVRYIL